MNNGTCLSKDKCMIKYCENCAFNTSNKCQTCRIGFTVNSDGQCRMNQCPYGMIFSNNACLCPPGTYNSSNICKQFADSKCIYCTA